VNLPAQARIVVIGGGAVGCSIAYHLAKMGQRDVVILEKSGLTHGSTWHAAGLVGQLRSKRNLTRLMQYSAQLYGRLEAETKAPDQFDILRTFTLKTDAPAGIGARLP